MKKLSGMKKDFSSLENKKLKSLDSISGGTGKQTNESWSISSCDQWNCADIDHYFNDGTSSQRQTAEEDCGTQIPTKTT